MNYYYYNLTYFSSYSKFYVENLDPFGASEVASLSRDQGNGVISSDTNDS